MLKRYPSTHTGTQVPGPLVMIWSWVHEERVGKGTHQWWWLIVHYLAWLDQCLERCKDWGEITLSNLSASGDFDDWVVCIIDTRFKPICLLCAAFVCVRYQVYARCVLWCFQFGKKTEDFRGMASCSCQQPIRLGGGDSPEPNTTMVFLFSDFLLLDATNQRAIAATTGINTMHNPKVMRKLVRHSHSDILTCPTPLSSLHLINACRVQTLIGLAIAWRPVLQFQIWKSQFIQIRRKRTGKLCNSFQIKKQGECLDELVQVLEVFLFSYPVVPDYLALAWAEFGIPALFQSLPTSPP